MEFLVLMKRFGTNKDMVMQDFGRQARLFGELSKFGHNIDFLCPDYVKFENKNVTRNKVDFYIRPYSPSRHFRFMRTLRKLIEKNKYDFIVGATEPLLGILSYKCSRKFNIKNIYDMQDDYRTYHSYKIPFVRYFDRKAVKNSDILLTVSDSLNSYVKKFRKDPITIQNGIDLKLFRKIGKDKARKALKLPKGKIIVYTGEISKLKGIDTLLESFNRIRKKYPDAYLLLSGTVDKNINIRQKNIIFREFPKREEVVLGLNAADMAVLSNPVNNFTRYCFPYKLTEYMACGLPIVGTDVGDVSLLLRNYKGSLCRPSDPDDLAEKIISKLENCERVDYSKQLKGLEWKALAKKLNRIVESV